MKRREFITLVGGAAAAWPLAARAQQGHIQRIAVLTLRSQETLAPLLSAFLDELQHLGFVEGRNVTVDYRWAEGDVKPLQPLARELLALKPDVALAAEPSAAKAMKSVRSVLAYCLHLAHRRRDTRTCGKLCSAWRDRNRYCANGRGYDEQAGRADRRNRALDRLSSKSGGRVHAPLRR